MCFCGAWENPDELEVIFKRDVVFNMSVFNGQALFGNACFKGLAGFDGCVFDRVAVWRGSRFTSRAMFRTVSFKGYSLFSQAKFCSDARFTNTCFSKGGNFTEARFESVTDFSGCYSLGKSIPSYGDVVFGQHRCGEDETFWRFIKQASQEAGYYGVAGESFYKERCSHFWGKLKGSKYNQLSGWQKFVRWLVGVRLLPELIFGRFLFGYGERPVRVLFVGLFIVLISAIFYSSPMANLSARGDGGVITERSFGDGLYFSVTTFTTLGFGDIFPASGHTLTRFVAMFEAISGAALMALFVVGLSKRYSRG
ncbi:MAG: potassium channel family protein [Deltaproteobacteria bacterium]|nr:potassium channel family protein [Deltaproteobacteria bacterium]